jgi:hypothetical protein
MSAQLLWFTGTGWSRESQEKSSAPIRTSDLYLAACSLGSRLG